MNFNFSMNRGNNGVLPVASSVISGAGAIISLIVGIGFIVIGLVFMAVADRAKDWPATEATVLSSESRTVYDSDNNRDTEYRITYTYTAEGTTQQGTEVSSVNRVKGSNFELQYNPDNPAETFSGSNSFLTWIFPAIGLILIIAAITRLVRAVTNRRRNAVLGGQQPLTSYDSQSTLPGQAGTQPQAPLPLAAQPTPLAQPPAASAPVSTNQQQQDAANNSSPGQFQK